ncbi:MAG: hypothetical protein ABIA04_13555 [Pseudomonadota bacterium]
MWHENWCTSKQSGRNSNEEITQRAIDDNNKRYDEFETQIAIQEHDKICNPNALSDLESWMMLFQQ